MSLTKVNAREVLTGSTSPARGVASAALFASQQIPVYVPPYLQGHVTTKYSDERAEVYKTYNHLLDAARFFNSEKKWKLEIFNDHMRDNMLKIYEEGLDIFQEPLKSLSSKKRVLKGIKLDPIFDKIESSVAVKLANLTARLSLKMSAGELVKAIALDSSPEALKRRVKYSIMLVDFTNSPTVMFTKRKPKQSGFIINLFLPSIVNSKDLCKAIVSIPMIMASTHSHLDPELLREKLPRFYSAWVEKLRGLGRSDVRRLAKNSFSGTLTELMKVASSHYSRGEVYEMVFECFKVGLNELLVDLARSDEPVNGSDFFHFNILGSHVPGYVGHFFEVEAQ